MGLELSTYFDFKQQIESYHRNTDDKIQYLEIYMKSALNKLSKLESSVEMYEQKIDKFMKDEYEFNMWYSRQNIFRRTWWVIRKYDYKRLKQIKENDGKL